MLENLDMEYAQYLNGFSLTDAWAELRESSNGLSLPLVWEMLKSLLFGRIVASADLLKDVLILSLLLVLLQLLGDSFGSARVATLARWVVGLAVLGLASAVFFSAMQTARQTVGLISDLVFLLLPIMFPLMAALGGVGTVSLISPALMFALNLLMQLMEHVIFPLLWFCAVLRLVSHLSPRFSLSRMAALFKDVAMGVMGIVSTLFVAFLSLSGIASSSGDGLAVKAAKTASGAFIPLVGRTLADSFDSVMSTVLVLKSAIGMIGGLALLLICAIPAVQLLAQALLFRVAGAVIQPLGDNEFAAVLSEAGNSLMLFFAAMAICGLFAFFSLALLVALGSITVMMR